MGVRASAEGQFTQGIPLFAELGAQDLELLSSQLDRRRYDRGETILAQGEQRTGLYIVSYGEVKLAMLSPDGQETIIGLLGPGDFFGELSLLDGEPQMADAVTRQPTELLVLSRSSFGSFVRARPEVALGLLASIARRLRRNAQLAYDVLCLDVASGLARILLDLARPAPGRAGILALPRITQAELAGMLGATRESVNKWLRIYERSGYIALEREAITVLLPAELRARAG